MPDWSSNPSITSGTVDPNAYYGDPDVYENVDVLSEAVDELYNMYLTSINAYIERIEHELKAEAYDRAMSIL